MSKKLIYCFLLISNVTLSQNIYNSNCDYRLLYEEFNLFVALKTGKQQVNISHDTVIEINVISCKGASEINVFKNKQLIIRGKTINGLRLLAKQHLMFDLITYEESIGVIEYYEPIKDGLWEYWDEKGEKIKDEFYKAGIMKPK